VPARQALIFVPIVDNAPVLTKSILDIFKMPFPIIYSRLTRVYFLQLKNCLRDQAIALKSTSKVSASCIIINDFMEGFYGADGIGLEGERETSIITMLMDNYAYTTLLLIPLYALSSYIIFRKEGYNYFEHLVLNCFITGHQAIFYSLAALIPVGNVHEIGVAIAVLCSVIFTFCVFWQLFKQKGILGVIIRTFLTYLLSLIFLGITLGLIAGISESLG